MSKLYDAIINNLFTKNGEGLENTVLKTLLPDILNATLPNKWVDDKLAAKISDPSTSPLSRAFLFDVTKSLEDGFIFNTLNAESKTMKEMDSLCAQQIKFIKDNSKAGLFKKVVDPFNAFVETKSSTFGFEPFEKALTKVKNNAPNASFISKLVCAIIETKTSMDQTEENIKAMNRIEQDLIPYAYAYAKQNDKIKHHEIREEIYDYFGLSKDSAHLNLTARNYLRGLAVNYMIKTHTQNNAEKHTDIEGNSDEFGLVTVYAKGEQGKLITNSDESKNVPVDTPIPQLIKQGQKIGEDDKPANNMKCLQQALIKIHKELDGKYPINENHGFLATITTYLMLASKLGIEDEGNFIGIALAEPVTEIASSLSAEEIKDICDKAYQIANKISKDELGEEIENPIKDSKDPLKKDKDIERFSKDKDKDLTPLIKKPEVETIKDYTLRNIRAFYKKITKAVIKNLQKHKEIFAELEEIQGPGRFGIRTVEEQQKYQQYKQKYTSPEHIDEIIKEIENMGYEVQQIERLILRSVRNGSDSLKISKKLKEALPLLNEHFGQYEDYFNFIKSLDKTHLISKEEIPQVIEKLGGVFTFYMPLEKKETAPASDKEPDEVEK